MSLESISYRLQSTGTVTLPIELNSNWSNADPVYGAAAPAAYVENVNGEGVGTIELQGAAKLLEQQTPGDTYVLGTLPSDWAPDRTVYTVVHTFTGTYTSLEITPSQINVFGVNPPAGPDYTFVSLEGVTYRPYSGTAGPFGSQPITINTTNWQSDYVARAQAAPGAFTDPQGIVHLQGLATQTSTTGSQANLLGTLPPTAWPDRTVYTIVQAAGSTSLLSVDAAYADVGINPQGQIWLIPSRPQPLPVFAFVSLDSVTYLR